MVLINMLKIPIIVGMIDTDIILGGQVANGEERSSNPHTRKESNGSTIIILLFFRSSENWDQNLLFQSNKLSK